MKVDLQTNDECKVNEIINKITERMAKFLNGKVKIMRANLSMFK
jgi:hypothetical protein